MHRRSPPAGAAALLLLAVALGPWPARADEIARFLERERHTYGAPALVAGILRAGRLVDRRALGTAQVELGTPARADQVFEIGSISKQFTAWAVLMLHEQGRVDLDAPIGRHLDELPPAWGERTPHQLLGHVSGLPDLEDAFGYGVYRETPKDEDFLQRLLALPVEAEPLTTFRYSNTNYWLLARLIERVSGESYADFMERHVFAPLGMRSTRSALPDRLLPGRAAGYERVGDELRNRDAMQPATGRGLGDIASTLEDMARWEREQRSPRLIGAASVQRARTPLTLKDGRSTGYGYGWFVEEVAARQPVLRHDGQTAGFTAAYARYPGRDLAVVVFANAYGVPTPSIAARLARLVDPALRGPVLRPARAADAARTARVRELLAAAPAAVQRWQEDWFSAAFWQQIKGSLPQIEAAYRRRGPLRRLVPVGPGGVQDAARPAWRVEMARAKRLMHFEFDDTGRVSLIRAEDE